MSAVALTMGALVGCSSTPSEEVPDDPAGTKTAVFEAEGCDLSEYSGHGWSNNATGCQTIQGQNTQKNQGKSKRAQLNKQRVFRRLLRR